MNFVAIDVETANPNLASICQVGIAAFRDGVLHRTWGVLVNPEDYFDDANVAVHGIDEAAVKDAPKWKAIFELLTPWLQGQIVACHTPFDRTAVSRACEKVGLVPHSCTWLDTARVARRAWPAFAQRGYGLANVTKYLNISFVHHDAKEDARAAGEILLRAMSESGLSLTEWLDRAAKPIIMGSKISDLRNGNPDGPLFGEMIVFTGALSMPRREAANMAASAGCEVDTGVNKHTTVLVVGDQDIARLSGHEKSTKHRKAEKLISEGQRIRIIGESDLMRLLAIAK